MGERLHTPTRNSYRKFIKKIKIFENRIDFDKGRKFLV